MTISEERVSFKIYWADLCTVLPDHAHVKYSEATWSTRTGVWKILVSPLKIVRPYTVHLYDVHDQIRLSLIHPTPEKLVAGLLVLDALPDNAPPMDHSEPQCRCCDVTDVSCAEHSKEEEM